MDPLIWQLILQLLLILINAFFASAEIAVVSLNTAKLRADAEDGDKRAAKLLRLVESPTAFLSTIQIAITLAGLLGSAFAATNFADRLTTWLVQSQGFTALPVSTLNTIIVILITLVLGYFTLVLGELVPKRIAMQKAESLSFAVIGVLRAVAIVTRPFVKLLSVSTNLVVRLFGLDPHADEENVTEEEIRMMVDVGEEKGVIEESQKDMINNIFEFDDIIAEDIMTPRTDVEAIDVEDGVAEALRVSVEEGFSRLPVYEDDIDNVIGLLYIKDLLPYVGQTIPPDLSLRSLVRTAYFVPGTKKCGELFTEMSEKHLQMAVVVDEYGGVAGIVTMEDLLESIVGNIQDEFDHEEEEVTQTGDNTFEVDGSLDIEEMSELLKVELPEGEYDTVAGFIMDRLGRIPQEDEHPTVVYQNVTFTVREVVERRIEKVHVEVTPLPEPEENEKESRKPEKKAGRDKEKDKDGE